MKVDNANGKEVMRLLQFLTMALMSMYGHRELVKKATVQVVFHNNWIKKYVQIVSFLGLARSH